MPSDAAACQTPAVGDGASVAAMSPRAPVVPAGAAVLLLLVPLLVTAAAEPGSPEFLSERLASGAVRLSPQAYRLQDIGPLSQALPDALVLSSEPDIPECACRHRCLHRPRCLGTAYRPRDGRCLLSAGRPLPERLSPADEPWLFSARLGVAFLDETCQRSADCELAVPFSVCREGVCTCREAFNRTAADGCRPLGRLVPVDGVRPAPEALLREESSAQLEDCRAACEAHPLCLAVEFSAGSSACRLYSAGITDDTAAANVDTAAATATSAEWVTLVRLLPVHTEPPPAEYVQVEGRWYSNHTANQYKTASRDCASRGGIVYPGREDGSRAALIAAGMYGTGWWVGLDDTGTEGEFVHSDGEPKDNLTTWLPGEPNNARGNEHCTSVRIGNGLNDLPCHRSQRYVCQWEPGVLRSLARGRPAWASWDWPTAGKAVDGDVNTWSGSQLPAAVAELGVQQLTVDLGGQHQVTAVLLVTGDWPAANTTLLLGSDSQRSDPASAAICRRLPGRFMGTKMARLYRCLRPVQGRYLHLVTAGGRVAWAEVAVIGAQLDGELP